MIEIGLGIVLIIALYIVSIYKLEKQSYCCLYSCHSAVYKHYYIPIISKRNPRSNDINYPKLNVWVNYTTGNAFILININKNNAKWEQIVSRINEPYIYLDKKV